MAAPPLDLEIAGESLRLVLPAGPLADSLAASWREFRAPAGAAGCVVSVHFDRPPVPLEQRAMPAFVRGTGGTLRLSTSELEAQVSADLQSASIRQSPERYPLETLLRLLLAERLRRRGGVLLHSVAVASPEGAAVFSGVSGAGKSTLGANARAGGLELLADELVAIVDEDGGPVAHGTPWNVGAPRSAPLKLLGLLAHAPSDSIETIPKSEVLRTLVGNTVLPSEDAETRASVFALLLRFVDAARCARLSFAPRPTVAAAVTAALRG